MQVLGRWLWKEQMLNEFCMERAGVGGSLPVLGARGRSWETPALSDAKT